MRMWAWPRARTKQPSRRPPTHLGDRYGLIKSLFDHCEQRLVDWCRWLLAGDRALRGRGDELRVLRECAPHVIVFWGLRSGEPVTDFLSRHHKIELSLGGID